MKKGFIDLMSLLVIIVGALAGAYTEKNYGVTIDLERSIGLDVNETEEVKNCIETVKGLHGKLGN